MERKGEGTTFTIDRKIFSSDIWFDSPWKLKIWIYLIGHANYKDNHFMGIPLKRGQLIRSYRKIREDCGYKVGYRMKYPSLDTIRRVCEDLTKELRISTRTVQAGTLITINNYNEMQPPLKQRTERRTEQIPYSDRTVTVQDNKDNKENNKKNINIYAQRFNEFWLKYPKKKSKGNAEKVWNKIKPSEELHNKILSKIEEAKNSWDWKKKNGQFIPYPATWLNAKGWEDDYGNKKGGDSDVKSFFFNDTGKGSNGNAN